MNIIEDGCSGGATSQANDAQSFDALIVSQVVQNVRCEQASKISPSAGIKGQYMPL